MDQLMLVLLVVAVIVLFIAAVWLFIPHKKETIDIHLDKNTKMNISHAENGSIRMEMTHVISEEDDEPLVPDVVGPYLRREKENVIDRDFIHKLWVFDSLDVPEKEKIMGVLMSHDIITEDEANEYLHGQNNVSSPDAPVVEDDTIPDEPIHDDEPEDDFGDDDDLNS